MGITRAEATAEVRQSNHGQKPAMMKLIADLPEKGQAVPNLLEYAEAGEAVGILEEELKCRQVPPAADTEDDREVRRKTMLLLERLELCMEKKRRKLKFALSEVSDSRFTQFLQRLRWEWLPNLLVQTVPEAEEVAEPMMDRDDEDAMMQPGLEFLQKLLGDQFAVLDSHTKKWLVLKDDNLDSYLSGRTDYGIYPSELLHARLEKWQLQVKDLGPAHFKDLADILLAMYEAKISAVAQSVATKMQSALESAIASHLSPPSRTCSVCPSTWYGDFSSCGVAVVDLANKRAYAADCPDFKTFCHSMKKECRRALDRITSQHARGCDPAMLPKRKPQESPDSDKRPHKRSQSRQFPEEPTAGAQPSGKVETQTGGTDGTQTGTETQTRRPLFNDEDFYLALLLSSPEDKKVLPNDDSQSLDDHASGSCKCVGTAEDDLKGLVEAMGMAPPCS